MRAALVVARNSHQLLQQQLADEGVGASAVDRPSHCSESAASDVVGAACVSESRAPAYAAKPRGISLSLMIRGNMQTKCCTANLRQCAPLQRSALWVPSIPKEMVPVPAITTIPVSSPPVPLCSTDKHAGQSDRSDAAFSMRALQRIVADTGGWCSRRRVGPGKQRPLLTWRVRRQRRCMRGASRSQGRTRRATTASAPRPPCGLRRRRSSRRLRRPACRRQQPVWVGRTSVGRQLTTLLRGELHRLDA